MTKPFVLLAMTAFNRERFIAEAIESVLAQDYTGWQLQIVDDGSNDSTRSIIESYVQRDSRIQAIYWAENRGAAAALQEASKQESVYLGWIDSDDALTPNALSELVPFLVNNPDVDCVYSQYNTMDANSTDTGLGYRCDKPYSKNRLLADFMVFHFRLIKWDAYKETGINLDLNGAVDYDFFLRFSEKYLIKHFPKSMYRYRQHPVTMSNQPESFQRKHSEIALSDALKRRNLSNQFWLPVKDSQSFLEVEQCCT